MKKIMLVATLFLLIGFQGKSQLKFENYSLIDEIGESSILFLADKSGFDNQTFEFEGNDEMKKRRKKRKKSRRGKKGSSSELIVGFKVGGNLANISGEHAGDDNLYHFGIAVGAFGQYNISDMLSIVGELNFEQKGYKNEYSETVDFFGEPFTTESSENVTFNYITIPIMGRAMFGDDLKFYVNAGPYFGLFAGGKIKSEVNINGEVTSGDAKIEDGIASLDIGVIGGVGAIIPVADSFSLLVDLRYTQGFTSIADEGDLKINNTTLGFNIGAVIPL